MRRFMVIPMAGLLVLAAAAPVAAGPNVSNNSGSLTVAEAYWESSDGGNESFGWVSVRREGRAEAFAELYSSEGEYVLCVDLPGEEDDYYGFVGTSTFGYGAATLVVGSNNSTAAATATLTAYTDSIDECNGIWEGGPESMVDVSFDLIATSGTIKVSGRESFHLPKEFNDRYSYRASYRLAEGSVAVYGVEMDAYGQIGKVSWSSHSNS